MLVTLSPNAGPAREILTVSEPRQFDSGRPQAGPETRVVEPVHALSRAAALDKRPDQPTGPPPAFQINVLDRLRDEQARPEKRIAPPDPPDPSHAPDPVTQADAAHVPSQDDADPDPAGSVPGTGAGGRADPAPPGSPDVGPQALDRRL
jgi:hypothetical protein